MAKRLKTKYTANGRTVWLQKAVREGWVIKVQSSTGSATHIKSIDKVGNEVGFTKAEAEAKFAEMCDHDERMDARLKANGVDPKPTTASRAKNTTA